MAESANRARTEEILDSHIQRWKMRRFVPPPVLKQKSPDQTSQDADCSNNVHAVNGEGGAAGKGGAAKKPKKLHVISSEESVPGPDPVLPVAAEKVVRSLGMSAWVLPSFLPASNDRVSPSAPASLPVKRLLAKKGNPLRQSKWVSDGCF